eukprot:356053-Pyramimonas_sp.AAC.1
MVFGVNAETASGVMKHVVGSPQTPLLQLCRGKLPLSTQLAQTIQMQHALETVLPESAVLRPELLGESTAKRHKPAGLGRLGLELWVALRLDFAEGEPPHGDASISVVGFVEVPQALPLGVCAKERQQRPQHLPQLVSRDAKIDIMHEIQDDHAPVEIRRVREPRGEREGGD